MDLQNSDAKERLIEFENESQPDIRSNSPRKSDRESLKKIHRESVDPKSPIEQLLLQVDAKIKANQIVKEPQVPYSKIMFTFADRTDKLYLFFGFTTAILCGLGLPSFVFLFGDIADSFQGGEPPSKILESITRTSKILTFIGLGVWACSYCFFTFLIIASERIGLKTRIHYLESILQQDIGWFDTISTSELSAKLGKECLAIQRAIGEKIGNIVMAFAMSISGLFFAFFKGAYFSALLLCYFPFMFGMTIFITIAFTKGFSENMKAYSQSAGYAEQALNAIKVVFAFSQEDTEIRNYEKYLERARKTGIKTHFMGALALGGFFLTLYGFYTFSFFVGSFMVTQQVNNVNSGKPYSSGDIMACFLGLVYGVFSLGLATPNLKTLSEGKAAGKCAFDIIERKPAIKIDNEEGKHLDNLNGRIEFKNVSFRYPSRPDQVILDNFTAVFEEGKTTAIVGASGSGKSTIVQLIERFYDPENGQVFIDGMELKDINLRTLRQKIGYVGQEPVLFNISIKENILYGNPNASDEEVIQALKSANAWDFIQEKMKENGIDTNVGNAGGQLSGGQKQRLAIARAFIKKPKILLLDEATSALDKKNEKEVQAAIDKIRKELGHITTIVIAHRLSTIRDADKIIVMQKGKIIEVGTHETLLNDFPNGTYSKFVQEQQQAENQNFEDNNQDEEDPKINIENYQDIDKRLIELQSKSRTSTLKQSKLKESVVVQIEKEMAKRVDQLDEAKLYEEEKHLEAMASKSYSVRLLNYNRPRINIYIGLLVSILQGALMPCFGGIMAKMLFVLMEVYNLDDMRTQANKWCALMLVFSICALITGFSQKFSFGVIGENVTTNIRRQLYRTMIEKHQGWFDERDNAPGILTSTLSSDAQIINGVSTEGLGSILEAVCSILTGIVIGFVFSWRMSLVCIGCTPFIVISGYMGAIFQQGLSVSSENSHKMADLLAGDAIMNYRTVASFAHEKQIVKDYALLLEVPKQKAINQAHKIGGTYGFSQFILYGVIATLFYAGAQFLDKFQEEPVDMFITIFAMMFGALESGQAQQFGPDMGKAKGAAKKIFAIMDKKSQISALHEEASQVQINLQKFIGNIEFHNVWFRYPTRKQDWVLKGLNLKIFPNESVALVGESGCGKSTLVSLLMRFYDVDYGMITLDGIDIRRYNLKQLRQMMGLVMQEPTLFNYTIQENILYGNPIASNSQILEAATIANAKEFIESHNIQATVVDTADALLKQLERNANQAINEIGGNDYRKKRQELTRIAKLEMKKGNFLAVEGDIDQRGPEKHDVQLSQGYKIECGLKGSKLSGGQKQRIAIARAILRKPKILILDEATSALDEESQKKVQVALDNVMNDRTSIVIAHRLSTVEKCNRVIVLEGGRVVEEGKFEQLKNREGGFFAQLASGMQNTNAKNQS